MGDKCNCYRFSPRDSLSGAVAQIADYLSKHPGWNETELKTVIDGLISATGVESFNGRTGAVILDKNDVNNLKIASAYFAEGDESIGSLDLVSLYNQGVRFVFTDFNSVTHGYNLAFALEYFSGSGNVVYYPMSTASGGGGNIVSVNGKTGAVRLKVVDVSNGNSPDENAYMFIDESADYPDIVSPDSNKLGGQLPSYYASAEEVSQLKNDLTAEQTARANADQALANNISDAWASGTTYAVGDYSISGNRLYKCKTAHTAGSAFNADYWDAVNVTSEIGLLESGKVNIRTKTETNTNSITISIAPVIGDDKSALFYLRLLDWATGDIDGAIGFFSGAKGGATGTIGNAMILCDANNNISSIEESYENRTITVNINRNVSYVTISYIY